MTIKVYIGREDFILGGLSVAVVNHPAEGCGPHLILRPGTGYGTWEEFDPTSMVMPEPSFKLPGEAGRALLDALAHHYEGSEDTRRLRADYENALRRGDEKDRLIADVLRSLTRAGDPR